MRWRLLFMPLCALLAWAVIAPLGARGDTPEPVTAVSAGGIELVDDDTVEDAGTAELDGGAEQDGGVQAGASESGLSRSLVSARDGGVAPVVSSSILSPSSSSVVSPSTDRPESESTTTPSSTIPATTALPTTTLTTTTTTVPPDSSPLFEPSLEVLGATTVANAASAQDQLGARALELMDYDWQRRFPDWTISFLGARQGLRALTYPSEQRIEVFVRDQDDEQSLLRVIAHEVGHVVDVMLNTEADRDRWIEARGLGTADWWPSEAKPDFATGAGDFAEAFAVWETGIRSRSSIAGQPTAEQLQLLAELAN